MWTPSLGRSRLKVALGQARRHMSSLAPRVGIAARNGVPKSQLNRAGSMFEINAAPTTSRGMYDHALQRGLSRGSGKWHGLVGSRAGVSSLLNGGGWQGARAFSTNFAGRDVDGHASRTDSRAHFSTAVWPEGSGTLSRARKMLDDLAVLLARLPHGFKNFYPRKQREAHEKARKEKQEKKGSEPPQDQKEQKLPPQLMIGTALLLLFLLLVDSQPQQGQEVTYQEFKTEYLERGKVDRLQVVNKVVNVHLLPEGSQFADAQDIGAEERLRRQQSGRAPSIWFKVGSVEWFERSLQQAQEDLGVDPSQFISVQYSDPSPNYKSEIIKALPSLLMFGILFYFLRNGMSALGGGGLGGGGKGGKRNIFSIGKSPAHLTKPGDKSKYTFKDVAGLDEAKVEIMEFVKFLRNPDRFTKLGAKIPKGALLVGPPGTGKTLMAKAVAGEANVPFYSISGSDFIEMFVGVGPSRVRDLFSEARKNSPCIIFIDEIDAVGRARSKSGGMGGNDERENTLNQMLVEMDGFQEQESVVVLAGTNRADILDPALLRPGRFDRQITIDKPDIKGRTQIFKVHLKKLRTNLDLEDLARRMAALTPGMAGADIANVCNEAALIAARNDKDSVELVDFEAAIDRIIGGLAKEHSAMTQVEKKIVAYHEAGHAVAGWFLEHSNPLLKVTIVPRGNGALGFAQYLPKELSLYNEEQLQDMMCVTLGGRAAEQVFFGKVSTGASDDLKKVSQIAYGQVTVYGMSDRIGNVSFAPDQSDNQFTKPYSEATAQIMDEEVKRIIDDAYVRTVALLEEKKDVVEALAQKLIAVETVNHDDLVEVMGPRPFENDAYTTFLKEKDTAPKEKKRKKKKKKAKAAEEKTEENADEAQVEAEEEVKKE